MRASLVEEIRLVTDKWQPLDSSQNPLRHIEDYNSLLGSLGQSPDSALTQLLQGPFEMLRSMFVKRPDHFVSTAPHGHEITNWDDFKRIVKGDPDLPVYYNVRELYPNCEPEIFEQASCGACWAFSTAGMLGDRICMATGQNITLSPQDMVNCAFEQYGCMGGYLIPAIDFLVTEGVCKSSCKPYKSRDEKCNARGFL